MKIQRSKPKTPVVPSTNDRVQELEEKNAMLELQISATDQRSDFLEELIAELAMQIY